MKLSLSNLDGMMGYVAKASLFSALLIPIVMLGMLLKITFFGITIKNRNTEIIVKK